MAIPGHVYVTLGLYGCTMGNSGHFRIAQPLYSADGRYRRHYCSIGWIVVTAHVCYRYQHLSNHLAHFTVQDTDLAIMCLLPAFVTRDATKDLWIFITAAHLTLGSMIAEMRRWSTLNAQNLATSAAAEE
jgi:hypothetical protein